MLEPVRDTAVHDAFALVGAAQFAPGHVLDGRYEIVGTLGMGGMGIVYEARRLVLGDRVAIKSLRPGHDSVEMRARFLTEARAAAHVRHPNVVQVFDFGDPKDSAPYIVMELVPGATLAQHLAIEKRLSADRALEILGPACAAVEAGHRRGVIHRDLKPANVMLARSDDDRETVKVLDFGLARWTDSGPRHTDPNAIAGTCEYMAPEAIRGAAPTPASDIFSLGVMLYEMVTGTLPFRGETSIATLYAVLRGTYASPDDHAHDLPKETIAAIRTALDPDPEKRPRSPEQFARLAAGRRQTPSVRPPQRAVASAAATNSRLATAIDLARPIVPERGDAIRARRGDVFVGRDRELSRLRAELVEAIHGRARLVLLRGAPGAGKSRLAEQIAREASEQGAEVRTGRFFEYAGSRPPACEVFLGMLHDRRGDHGTDVVRIDDGLLREATSDTPGIEIDGARWRLLTGLADGFAARAGHRPLVLVLDDLQWASRLDLEVARHLHQSLGKRGTLIIATLREEDAEREPLAPWITALAAQRASLPIDVRPLAALEVRAWLEASLPGLRIAPEDAARIERVSGGSPWQLGEIASRLVASGKLSRDVRGWSCASLGDLEIPDTVAALLEARIAGLDPALREVLEAASVVGDDFRIDTVCGAMGREVGDALDAAEEARLLTSEGVSSGNDLRFENGALRRVLYDGTKKTRRRALHRRVAEILGARYANDVERIAPVLAWHHAAMGDDAQALSFALRAAEDALARQDEQQAAEQSARAAEAHRRLVAAGASTSDRDEARRLRVEGAIAARRGRGAEAVEALSRTAKIAFRFDRRLPLGSVRR